MQLDGDDGFTQQLPERVPPTHILCVQIPARILIRLGDHLPTSTRCVAHLGCHAPALWQTAAPTRKTTPGPPARSVPSGGGCWTATSLSSLWMQTAPSRYSVASGTIATPAKACFETVSRLPTMQGHTEPVLLLSAQRNSLHRDGPTGGPSALIYNIGWWARAGRCSRTACGLHCACPSTADAGACCV